MIEKYAGNPLLGNPDDEFRRPSSSDNMPFCPDQWKLISKKKEKYADLGYQVTCQAPPSYTGGNRGCGSTHTGYTAQSYSQTWARKCQVNWGPNKCALPSSYCGKGSGYTPESCTNFLKYLDRSDITVGCGTISKVIDTEAGSEEVPRSQWPKLVRDGSSAPPSTTATQPPSTTKKEIPHTITATRKPMSTTTTQSANTTASPITSSVSSPSPASFSSLTAPSPTMPSATTTTSKMPTTTQQVKLSPAETRNAVASPTVADCPDGWALINNQDKTCQAPNSYSGGCNKTQSFANYSDSQKQDWVNKCNNDWGPYQKGTQEAFSAEGKCYEDNCYNNPNSPYFRKPLPQCPENWSFVKRDCKYNVCQAPKNYIGACPKEMKFYNETIGGQATGITTSFADYYTQKCGLNWGDRRMTSSLSYREPVKKQMIQDYLVSNPNVDDKKVLRKLGIMDNVVPESFSTNYSKF